MKRIIILSILILSGCATNEPKKEALSSEQLEAIPKVAMNLINIRKLYMCHYFFDASISGAEEEQKEKVKRISLSLKLKATRLALETGGLELNDSFSENSKKDFIKFMDKTSAIKDIPKRNEAFTKFVKSCAVTAGVKI